jgi:hypothetical protein
VVVYGCRSGAHSPIPFRTVECSGLRCIVVDGNCPSSSMSSTDTRQLSRRRSPTDPSTDAPGTLFRHRTPSASQRPQVTSPCLKKCKLHHKVRDRSNNKLAQARVFQKPPGSEGRKGVQRHWTTPTQGCGTPPIVMITANCDWIAMRCMAILQCHRTPRGCAGTRETALASQQAHSWSFFGTNTSFSSVCPNITAPHREPKKKGMKEENKTERNRFGC